MFEDTRAVIGIRISKKNRQHNGQKKKYKRTNNDLQNIHIKHSSTVISRERGKNREVFTTSGTYPWSFVTQIFHNGQPSHGDECNTFEVMTSI